MIKNIDLGTTALDRIVAVNAKVRAGEINLIGHSRRKTYSLLSCATAQRIKVKYRVYFKNEDEAKKEGYRPCGHCLGDKYRVWINAQIIE